MILTATSKPSSIRSKVHGHIRTTRKEVGDGWRKMQEPEAHRRADPQSSPRRRLKIAHCAVRIVEVGENALRPPKIAPARLGEAQRSCGAVEQPGSEFVLERPDVAADRGLGQTELASRPRKRLGPGDGDKSA
jgi:hypothetical protein